jgi:photosystem II stability/assembly factor-like uncharacterized protein
MTLTEKTTHAAEAKAKLVEQFRGKPGFEGLLDSYLEQIQELEGVFFDLLSIVTDPDSQTGAQLDLIGRIIGEDRKGKTDAVYLQAIKARRIINRASGTVDEIRLMLSQIVDNLAEIEEYYPASFVARLSDAYTGDTEELARLLAEIRAAGISCRLETTGENDADTFQFASGDTEEADESAGFGGYRWIAVGDDAGTEAYIATSDGDQTTWTQRTNPKDEDLNGVASDGSGTVIAVGNDDGSDPYAIRSTDDGETWAEIDLPDIVVDLNAVCYSPELDLWVAVGDDAGSQSLVLTSDDGGESWIIRSIPGDINLYCVCWCPSLGLFLTGGDTVIGTDYLSSSPDGITWTTRPRPGDGVMRGICWSETLGLAVAVGYSDGIDGYIATSPDGINWTERSNPKNLWLYGVCWCEAIGLFVAVGDPDADSYILTSPDGINWTEQSAPVAITLFAVAQRGDSELVAVGDTGGGDAAILTSSDGINWTEQANPANYALFAVTGVERSLGGVWAAVTEA